MSKAGRLETEPMTEIDFAETALRLEKILVHVEDGAVGSSAALVAAAIARSFDADLILAHVALERDYAGQTTYREPSDPNAAFWRGPAEHDRRLRRLAKRLAVPDERCHFLALHYPDPAEIIVESAREQAADLIVLGIGERRAPSPAEWEEARARVLRQAPCSVLSVRPGSLRVLTRLSSLVVAIDASESSRRLIRVAGALALRFQVPLRVVHVCSHEQVEVAHGEGVAEAVRRLVSEALAGEASAGLGHSEHVLRGLPADEIASFAAHEASPLIVVGTRERSAAPALLEPSVAERVTRNAAAPTLALKLS